MQTGLLLEVDRIARVEVLSKCGGSCIIRSGNVRQEGLGQWGELEVGEEARQGQESQQVVHYL